MPSGSPAVAATAALRAAATEATAAAATEAAAALRSLFGLIDPQGAAVEHRAVHRADGGRSLVGVAHGHEGEAARPAGLAVADDVDVRDFARSGERLPERLGRHAERKVADVKTSTHGCISLERRLFWTAACRRAGCLPSNEPPGIGGTVAPDYPSRPTRSVMR